MSIILITILLISVKVESLRRLEPWQDPDHCLPHLSKGLQFKGVNHGNHPDN